MEGSRKMVRQTEAVNRQRKMGKRTNWNQKVGWGGARHLEQGEAMTKSES